MKKFPTFQEASNQLQSSGYASLPLVLPKGAMQEAGDSFLKFLDNSQSCKDEYVVPIARGANKCNEIGYKSYTTYDSMTTRMEWVQYNASLPGQLKEQGNDASEGSEMMANLSPIYDYACDMFKGMINTFESEVPGLHDKFYTNSDDRYPHYSAVRFIKYGIGSEQTKQDYLGFSPHFDSGGCTMPLHESGPGLKIGRSREAMQPAVREQDTAVFFPGLNLYKAFPAEHAETFFPSLHVVDPTLNERYNETTSRWVVIFFVDHLDFKKCDVCSEKHW